MAHGYGGRSCGLGAISKRGVYARHDGGGDGRPRRGISSRHVRTLRSSQPRDRLRAVFLFVVPNLTRNGDIKLNARVSLRRLVVAISFADAARTPFQCCLNGRLGRGGGGLALVPARLCRMDFQALTVCPESVPPSQSTIFRAGFVKAPPNAVFLFNSFLISRACSTVRSMAGRPISPIRGGCSGLSVPNHPALASHSYKIARQRRLHGNLLSRANAGG
jgi:hypothetical protein